MNSISLGTKRSFELMKVFSALTLLALGLPSAFGFSLIGIKEGFQTEALGYFRLTETDVPGAPLPNLFNGWTIDSDDWQFAPHNLGEGFRWNVPVLYYSYDESFLRYFGSNGVAGVDAAANVFNALPKVSEMSSDLSEFPLDEARFNYTAAALHLFDIKSAAMEMFITRLGLADPERWTWCIRARIGLPGGCPNFDFDVIQRNFDPLTWAQTKYVNGNLFTYTWQQFCAVFNDRSDAIETKVDPASTYETALATPKITYPNILYFGLFHSSLTRDDAAGLRYLYATNNYVTEIAPTNVVMFETNNVGTNITTLSVSLLAAQALTNSPAGLAALYPGLVAIQTNSYPSNVVTTNIVAFITNVPPWTPAFGLLTVGFVTNRVTNSIVIPEYTYANLLTFQFINGQWVAVPLTSLSALNGTSVGQLQTTTISVTGGAAPATTPTLQQTTSSRPLLHNGPVGEFFIMPTNWCDISVVSLQQTTVTPVTNFLAGTNILTIVNTNITTNLFAGQILGQTRIEIDYQTNHVFFVHPVLCTPGTVALRGGVEKVSFQRHDMDSLLGRFFEPITNDYTLNILTNNEIQVQRFRRVVTAPDILIAAGDGALNAFPRIDPVDRGPLSEPAFNTTQINTNSGVAGPGTIETPVGSMVLTFNKSGTSHINEGPFFVSEASSFTYFVWGSYDGSTNPPVVYPNETSIQNLVNQAFLAITPDWLASWTEGQANSVTLSVVGSGGTAPYNWTASSTSPLPAGLSLDANSSDTTQATLSGTVSQAGSYNFIIRATGADSQFVEQAYTLVVNPP
jgi:hypothetical protein